MKRRTIATASLGILLVGVAACSSTSSTTSTASSVATTSVATTAATTATPTTATPTTATPTTAAPPPTLVPTASDVAFTPFVRGVNKPVEIAWRKDDATLFLAQQDGKIVPIRNGVVGAPVLDIGALVSTGAEQGLLGLAFHPTKSLAYIDYTNTQGNTVIAEYPVGADGVFATGSARTVLTIAQPYANHNGGKVLFGPDGDLYIGMGDGGAAGDPQRHGLDLTQLLAKILRIDPEASGGQPYTVPSDNPFVATPGARGEVWSYGLRNPWRFAFDRATGDLWVADVGQNLWEEVDVVPAAQGAGRGANFGWSALEGNHPFNADQSTKGALAPVHEYTHGDDGCSVSGGAVYRGTSIPSLIAWFVYSDYCSGKVWAVHPDGTNVTLGKLSSVSAIAEGPQGELYVLAYAEGTIYRIDHP